ncbi:MAG: alginate export family protein, partial [Chloroflexia bacterium]
MKLAFGLLVAALLNAAEPAPASWDFTIAKATGEKLPSWVKLSGEFRSRFEGRTGFNFQPGNDDAYSLIRIRANIALLPTPWLEVFFQGQDSRVGGIDASRPLGIFKDPADIRQAYVRFGPAGGPIKLTVGRQLLNYGSQRILGPLDWTNNSRTWDAAKLEIGTTDAKVDLFVSSVV